METANYPVYFLKNKFKRLWSNNIRINQNKNIKYHDFLLNIIIIINSQAPSNIIMTLDNPLVLEQQLEALEHHKKVLERRAQYQTMLQEQGSNYPSPNVKKFYQPGYKADQPSESKTKPSYDVNYKNVPEMESKRPIPFDATHNVQSDEVIYSNLLHKNALGKSVGDKHVEEVSPLQATGSEFFRNLGMNSIWYTTLNIFFCFSTLIFSNSQSSIIWKI